MLKPIFRSHRPQQPGTNDKKYCHEKPAISQQPPQPGQDLTVFGGTTDRGCHFLAAAKNHYQQHDMDNESHQFGKRVMSVGGSSGFKGDIGNSSTKNSDDNNA